MRQEGCWTGAILAVYYVQRPTVVSPVRVIAPI
jgi:hypothetical protein